MKRDKDNFEESIKKLMGKTGKNNILTVGLKIVNLEMVRDS